MSNKLTRKYGLFTAICMVVGIVIGSGVFFKAGDILAITGGDMSTGVYAWIIGGCIMLACLLSFSFMSQRHERVNGIVDYAEALVGPKYGYIMGWFSTTVYFPAMTSVLAWVSARYTMAFLLSAFPNLSVLIPNGVTGPETMVLAGVYLIVIYAMNNLSPRIAGKFQTGTTIIKMIPLALMAVVGLIAGITSGLLQENFTTDMANVQPTSSNPLFAAVCATAFAYEGWIIATSINSEIKDSKKNMPKALIVSGIVIMATYLLYYIGAAGGATKAELMEKGATVAYTNIFGGVVGNILNLFIAISCIGTTNGLMLGCTRCMYSLADRKRGPKSDMYSQVDKATNMPANSATFALVACAVWFLYFYVANLWGGVPAGAPFAFDSSELPIIAIYMMYLPIFICWMVKAKGESTLRRFVVPALAFAGSVFMIIASIYRHQMGCLWFMIVFIATMIVGLLLDMKKKK